MTVGEKGKGKESGRRKGRRRRTKIPDSVPHTQWEEDAGPDKKNAVRQTFW